MHTVSLLKLGFGIFLLSQGERELERIPLSLQFACGYAIRPRNIILFPCRAKSEQIDFAIACRFCL